MAVSIPLIQSCVAICLCVCLGCSTTRPATTLTANSVPVPRQVPQSQLVRDWNAWGDANLQDGDILFMRGDCYLMMGTLNFSEVSTDITASRFSHIGLIAIEQGRAYVYDLRSQGCLRTRFGDLLAQRTLHQVAVKRHREATALELAQTADFCRDVFRKQDKYDDDLELDNGRLYCTELVEEAYRLVGHPLSDPVEIRELPNYERHQRTIQLVCAVTRIEPDQRLLLPGNDQIGIWANPSLELIVDAPDTKAGPRDTP